jgi:GNAT superfamily N-acetyltransferase
MLSFRPATELDDPFLCALYGSTREEELRPVGWDPARVEAFIRMQFDYRSRSYAVQFPKATHDIILSQGLAVGAWILDRRPAEIRIVDVAILPGHRGKGYGGELIRRLQEEAAASGRGVSLSVDRNSPAHRLYARMGFAAKETGDPVRIAMAWTPIATPAGASA